MSEKNDSMAELSKLGQEIGSVVGDHNPMIKTEYIGRDKTAEIVALVEGQLRKFNSIYEKKGRVNAADEFARDLIGAVLADLLNKIKEVQSHER